MRAEREINDGMAAQWLDRTGGLVLLCTALMALLLIRLGSISYYSNDAAQYWSTITNLLQGQGIRTSAVYYEVQAVHGLPAHQTVWPPGFPLVAAAFAWTTGLAADRTVAVLNALAHCATALMLYWLVLRLRDSRPVAAAFALGYLVYAPSLVLVLSGLSEPCSTLLTITAIACVARAFHGDAGERNRWLALAAAAIGAGSWFRYQAIFLAVPLGLLCLTMAWHETTPSRALGRTVALMTPSGALFGALLVRNWLLTGTWTGGNGSPRGNTIAELAFQAKWAVLSFFGGGAGWIDRILIVAFALSAIVAAIALWRRGAPWQVDRWSVNAATGAVALTGAVLTTLIILVLASRSRFYTLEGRYFHAVVLLGVIGLVAIWPRDSWRSSDTTTSVSLRLLAVSAASLVVLQLNGLRAFVRTGGDIPGLRQALAVAHEGRSLEEFLRTRQPSSAPVLSNQSQLLHLILQRPTFSVPERRLTPRVWTGAEIVAEARRFGVQHAVVFRQLAAGAESAEADYVWQMSEKPPPGLIPLADYGNVRLYRIAPN